MKSLMMIPALFLLFSFTHPFAQTGSVDNDSELLKERIEKAHENQVQEKRAKEAIKKQQQRQEELDRHLQPDILLQDNGKKEGSVE